MGPQGVACAMWGRGKSDRASLQGSPGGAGSSGGFGKPRQKGTPLLYLPRLTPSNGAVAIPLMQEARALVEAALQQPHFHVDRSSKKAKGRRKAKQVREAGGELSNSNRRCTA